MKERRIPYRGQKITVYFNPDRCTHVAECLMGAPEVFDSGRRPWVTPDAAPPDLVVEVVLRCPTGALHFERHDHGASEPVPDVNRIYLQEDGPLILLGNIRLIDVFDRDMFQGTRALLCRCGVSSQKPFCDGTHSRIGFVTKSPSLRF